MKTRLIAATLAVVGIVLGPSYVKPHLASAATTTPLSFVAPMHGNVRITGFLGSVNGENGDHKGPDYWAVDFVSDNSAVYPAAEGTVVFIGQDVWTGKTPNYGYAIVIDHGADTNGAEYSSIYTHLADDSVFEALKQQYNQDQKAHRPTHVDPSKQIGTMFDSGCPGCGKHLHFAVRASTKNLQWQNALFGKAGNYVAASVNIWQYASGGGTAWIPGLPWPQARSCPDPASLNGPNYSGWCLTLQADNPQPSTGGYVTLTAQANPAVSTSATSFGLAPYTVIIQDEHGNQVARCLGAATCTASVNDFVAEARDFTAFISRPFSTGNVVMAQSDLVTVTWTKPAAAVVDDFNTNQINPSLWNLWTTGTWPANTGPQIEAANQELEITLPVNNSYTVHGGGLNSVCSLHGDFDVQADFRLIDWFDPDYVKVGFYAMASPDVADPGGMERDGGNGGHYLAYFGDRGSNGVPTSDTTGTMRLVRSGSTVTGYYLSNGSWTALYSASSTTADARLHLGAWDLTYTYSVDKIAFDNVVLNSGTWTCPS